MEKTISITPSQLTNINKTVLAKYHSVYIGSEFCENKLPSIKDIEILNKTFNKENIIITTPILSQKKLLLLKDTLTYLYNNNLIKGVVINDWGLLEFVRNNLKNLDISIGRFITWEIYEMNEKFKNIFFKKYNIKSIEVDNNIVLNKWTGKTKYNMHYPLRALSLTRYCSYIKDFTSSNCNQECEKIGYTVIKNQNNTKLILFSTSYFVLNNFSLKIQNKDVKRIVTTYIPNQKKLFKDYKN